MDGIRDCIIGSRRRNSEEVLPPPLENAHARAIVPSFVPHPSQTSRVSLNDDMFGGMGILEICVDLYSASE